MSEASINLLEVRDLSKSFAGVSVLRDIAFTLDRGEVVTLVGENGAGKSTLKNILSGLLQPDAGEIVFDGTSYAGLTTDDAARLGIGTIHQELSLFGNLSVAENVHMPLIPHVGTWVDWRAMNAATAELLSGVLETAIDPTAEVDSLSLGERQLVEIAKAIHRSSSVLILDEPTTCLGLQERRHLFDVVGRLRRQDYGIIYITHFMEEVYALSDRILVLRDGVVTAGGTPAELPPDKLTSAMVGRELVEMHIAPPPLPPAAPIVFKADRITDPTLVRDVSFELRAGEILGIGGLMGAGRTELAEVLIGLREGSGTVTVNGDVFVRRTPKKAMDRGVVLVSEDRRKDQAFLGRNLRENVTAPSLSSLTKLFGSLSRRREAAVASALLLRFAVQPSRLSTPMASLSGGNQQKAIIGRWLDRTPRVCILDEPTKGVDVGARATVHQLIVDLAGQGVAFILISSDIPELVALSHRVLVLHKGLLAGWLPRESLDPSRILYIASTGQDR